MLCCPSCRSDLPSTVVRAARSVALCPTCDSSVQLAQEDGGWTAIGVREPEPPKGIELVDRAGTEAPGGYREPARASHWRASIRWRRTHAWYPSLMAVGSLLATASFLFGPHRELAEHYQGVLPLYAVPLWLVVGASCGWWALAPLRNRTVVSVIDGRVECRHGPVPVVGEKSRPVALDDVELFEVERRDPAFVAKNLAGPTWQVVARHVGGRRTPVVTRLPEERHARWLQRKLDSMLE